MSVSVSASGFRDGLHSVIRDSLINIDRVARLEGEPSGDWLKGFLDQCQSQRRSPWDIIKGDPEQLTASRAALLLRLFAAKWQAGDEAAADTAGSSLLALDFYWGKTRAAHTTHVRLTLLLETVGEMTLIPDAAPDQARLVNVGRRFERLATVLAQSDPAQLRAAFGCAQSAVNFSGLSEQVDETVRQCEMTLAWAIQLERSDWIVDELTRRAHHLSRRALDRQTERLAAFDAWERALRFTSLHAEHAENCLGIAQGWIREQTWLQPLSAYFVRFMTAETVAELPEKNRVGALGLMPVWPEELETAARYVVHTPTIAQELETSRVRLADETRSNVALASWGTFDFELRSLRRAVPHLRSILLERDADSMFLLLAHEITHVASMLGRVGSCTWALRLLLVELELRLGLRGDSAADQARGARLMRERSPHSLPTDIAQPEEAAWLLLRVEQQLEIMRKLQLVEATWAPWFEGIAVFAEIFANPADDAKAFTLVGGVMANLMDFSLANEAQKRGCSTAEAATQLWSEAEQTFGAAQDRIGGMRLQSYLRGGQAPKYFVGVIAARAIVAAWRRTLGHPLSSAEAFKALLHATRGAPRDLIPDLSLPLTEFQPALVARHAQWMRELASVSAADLNDLLSHPVESSEVQHYAWRGNRIVRIAPDEEESLAAQLARMIEQTRRCLSAPAQAARLDGASDELMALAGACSERLRSSADQGEKPWREPLINRLLVARCVLPIGRAECPFWLIPRNSSLFVLIRTREESSDTSKAGFNAEAFPLPPESYAQLEAKVRRGGPSRIRLTRVAWLGNEAPGETGRNFLVFQCEDWMYVRNAGILHAAAEVEPSILESIRVRLAPPELVATQESLTGGSLPCARRTLAWLESANPLAGIRSGPDFQPWIDHVRHLANTVIDADEQADMAPIHQALLRFVLGGQEPSPDLAANGLKFLERHGLASVFVDLLHATGRQPAMADTRLRRLCGELAAGGVPLFAEHDGKLDFAPPTPEPSAPRS